MQILLAEDIHENGPRVQYLLEMAGHNITRVNTEREAFAILERGSFPVVVADEGILGVNGFELCQEIRVRQSPECVYILMLTKPGADLPPTMDDGGLVDEVLPYPVDAKSLRMRLHLAERLLCLAGEMSNLLGLMPVCASCKRIHQDEGMWHRVERYLAGRGHAPFNHTLCPDCLDREFARQDGASALQPSDPSRHRKPICVL